MKKADVLELLRSCGYSLVGENPSRKISKSNYPEDFKIEVLQPGGRMWLTVQGGVSYLCYHVQYGPKHIKMFYNTTDLLSWLNSDIRAKAQAERDLAYEREETDTGFWQEEQPPQMPAEPNEDSRLISEYDAWARSNS